MSRLGLFVSGGWVVINGLPMIEGECASIPMQRETQSVY